MGGVQDVARDERSKSDVYRPVAPRVDDPGNPLPDRTAQQARRLGLGVVEIDGNIPGVGLYRVAINHDRHAVGVCKGYGLLVGQQ